METLALAVRRHCFPEIGRFILIALQNYRKNLYFPNFPASIFSLP
jgi:hypothetical protein